MTKHTPGPWHVHGDTAGDYQVNACFTRIARIDGQKVPSLQELANATLMAAAPDLLVALKEAEAWLNNMPLGHRSNTVLPKIQAAIAKAETI
jgi:hypothetical protein